MNNNKALSVGAAARKVAKLARLGVKASILPTSEGKFRIELNEAKRYNPLAGRSGGYTSLPPSDARPPKKRRRPKKKVAKKAAKKVIKRVTKKAPKKKAARKVAPKKKAAKKSKARRR